MQKPIVTWLIRLVLYLGLAAMLFAPFLSSSDFFAGPEKSKPSSKIERNISQLADSAKIRLAAFSTAQRFVRANLDAPATAEFPSTWGDEAPKDLGEGLWYVHSYVDIENTFGAKKRTFYVCELHTFDNGQNWTMEKLIFNE